MRIKDAQLVPCRLFIEFGDRTFDALEVEYALDSGQNIPRRMALEIEQSPTRTVRFLHKAGTLPVQGSFLCLPYDSGFSVAQSLAYEKKLFPRAMNLDVRYENPAGPGLFVRGRYCDTAARGRLQQVIDRNSILPLFSVETAEIPLKSGFFRWTPDLKDHILILRLWHNKMLRSTECAGEMT